MVVKYGDSKISMQSLFLQFLKIILGVKKSTPNCILYGELGRFPIEVFVKSRMIGMWRTW